MPIDLEARRKVASALSAFMRGEIDNHAFDDAINKGLSRDAALEGIRTALWFHYDDCMSHQISIAEEREWNYLRRTLAFLKSDFEEPPVRRLEPASVRRGKLLLGLASLISIATAVYLAITRTRYWLFLPGTVIGLPYCVVLLLSEKQRRGAEDPNPFYPFASIAQWRRYEPLLDDEHLPKYDPAMHGRPIRSGGVAMVTNIWAGVLSVFLMPVLMLLFLLPRKRDRALE